MDIDWWFGTMCVREKYRNIRVPSEIGTRTSSLPPFLICQRGQIHPSLPWAVESTRSNGATYVRNRRRIAWPTTATSPRRPTEAPSSRFAPPADSTHIISVDWLVPLPRDFPTAHGRNEHSICICSLKFVKLFVVLTWFILASYFAIFQPIPVIYTSRYGRTPEVYIHHSQIWLDSCNFFYWLCDIHVKLTTFMCALQGTPLSYQLYYKPLAPSATRVIPPNSLPFSRVQVGLCLLKNLLTRTSFWLRI
jgi:hypothetical protein